MQSVAFLKIITTLAQNMLVACNLIKQQYAVYPL